MKALLGEARSQKAQAEVDLVAARTELKKRKSELGWKSHALFHWAFKKRVAALRTEVLPQTREEVERLEAWSEASIVNASFDLGTAVNSTFDALKRAFERMSSSAAIWDVTSEADVDRVRERSSAHRAVERTPVTFRLAAEPVLNVGGPVPRLENFNGEDVYLYPALAIAPDVSADDFALLDYGALRITVQQMRWVEDATPPKDALVVGSTWEKVNKNGSRDMRFKDNRQLPILALGRIRITSDTGMEEEWQVSDWAAAEAFGQAWDSHITALRTAMTSAP